MRYHPVQRNIVLTVFFSILAALALNACGDANNVTGPPAPVPLSPDAKLSSLTVNTGPLDPPFSSDVAIYTVAVATDVGSVTVAATPEASGAKVTLNGQPTTPQSVSLGPAGSSTPIPIVVTAVNGSQNTYIVTVNRAPPGGNNNLQSLTVSPGPLAPAFIPSTTIYSVNVASTLNSVAVSATLQDTNASMIVNGQGTSSGQARTISLNGPGTSTPILIVVTAPNGIPNTYIVTVNQAARGGNDKLKSLTVSPGPLAPAFIPSTTIYSVNVANSVNSVIVTAQPQDSGATVSINGQTTQSLSVQLGGPNTRILIKVRAPNDNDETYTVDVNRAAPSENNNLSALVVSAGALNSVFSPADTEYDVAVPNTTTSTTVTATVQDSTATLTINGSPATSGLPSAPIDLSAELNKDIPVVVTAGNRTTRTYTVTIRRAPPDPPPPSDPPAS